MALVYHFCNKEFGLENIEKRRLKVATINELNDPFEMQLFSSPIKAVRGHLKDFKEGVAREFGLLCFSKSYMSPVQWAHYSDKHRGLCLGFEVDEERLHTVEYKYDRVSFDPTEYALMSAPERFDLMTAQLRAKHSQWRYEREVRQVFLLKETHAEGLLHFRSFDQIGKLRQAIVGCVSDITRSELNEKLGDLVGEVECFKVRTAFKSFNIVRNKDKTLWS
ncbi:DUF2971 domain-containing protein [Pseudomonas nitroreducens]|uniref:DUF2971 domain-containing protein n=1 Tax=Pseudomonas nitroreducens TaxID=46680 RepID=UPI00351D1AA0